MRPNPKIVSLGPGATYAAAGVSPNRAVFGDIFRALRAVPEFSAKHGLVDVEDLEHRVLGKGHYAFAFLLDNGMVLKITDDEADARVALLVMREGNGKPGLPYIEGVYKLPGLVVENETDVDTERSLYAIVMEPVTTAKKAFASYRLNRRELGEAVLLPSAAELLPSAELKLFVRQVRLGVQWLAKRGVQVIDLHDGNFGYASGGRPVLMDFGHDSVQEGFAMRPIPLAKNANELLFHGTSTKELTRLQKGGYVAENLYVGDSIENIAGNYAEQTAEGDGSDPVVIHLDGGKLRRLGRLEPDVHRFGGGDEEEQVGQQIYSGPLREAIVRIEAWGDGGERDVKVNSDQTAAERRRDVVAAKMAPIIGESLAHEAASGYVQGTMDAEGENPEALEAFLRHRQRHAKTYKAKHLTDEKIAEAVEAVTGAKRIAPNKRAPLRQAKIVFGECFDVIERRFPDFGECELHQDEGAASDNGAGSERQFGYCAAGDPIVIAFASKIESVPMKNIRGLMRHEFGHALDFRYGRALPKLLGRRLPDGAERRADAIAEAVFGEPIRYDDRLIQCVQCDGVSPRPRRLPK